MVLPDPEKKVFFLRFPLDLVQGFGYIKINTNGLGVRKDTEVILRERFFS